MAGDILINTSYSGNTVALGDNIVAFSALSNDVSYEQAMALEYKKRHRQETVLVVLSTSGKSKNVITLANVAKNLGAELVLITGKTPDLLLSCLADVHIVLDSTDAGMLESAFDFIGHLMVKRMA
jgi:D-sedoheptulose 7-phosphate isomerase